MDEQMPEAVRKGEAEAEESVEHANPVRAQDPQNEGRDSLDETPSGYEVDQVPEEAPDDIAERPGPTNVPAQHADELADEWGKESFPGSDPQRITNMRVAAVKRGRR